MPHYTRLLKATLFASLLLSALPSLAAVGPMSYQGRLLDTNGVPVNATLDITVSIFDDTSNGTLKYQEEFSAAGGDAVIVNDGVYSIMIGEQSPTGGDNIWDAALWSDNPVLYLELEVGGETLTPRSRISSSPFSMTSNNSEALGSRSADDYDTMIGRNCTASKGKWLEITEQCLGIGSSILNEYATNLTEDEDFQDLDISKADLTDTDFSSCGYMGYGTCNFSNTTFKGTTLSPARFDNTNLSGATWDGVILVGTTSTPTIDLSNATIQNMDLSKLNLSNATLTGLSAANLTACPAGLPTTWSCREMYMGSGRWFLLGPNANLAAGSAASSFRFGSSYLDLEKDALNGANLTDVKFVGNIISQHFENVDLTNADLNYTTITNTRFNNATLNGTTFVNSFIDKPVFMGAGTFSNVDFTNAKLTYVNILKPVSNANFSGATLINVSFQNVDGSDFTSAVLDNVDMDGTTANLIFKETRFYNGFQHGATPSPTNTYLGGSIFEDVIFSGGSLEGDFKAAVFTNSVTFEDITFEHLNLCQANIPLVDPVAPHDDLASVNWLGPNVCPNSVSSSNCDSGSRMTDIQWPCEQGIP